MKKIQKVKELHKTEYKTNIYFWAVMENGKVYMGVAPIKNPIDIDWVLVKTPE